MNQAPCWCGNTALESFSPAYNRCPACSSLVLRQLPKADIAHVVDEQHDLYGQNYYLSHLPLQYGYADFQSRVRDDLFQRCAFWLRTLLKYKLPPAQVLELGAAHGGFVALLQQTGFAATGLELSPWVVQFARDTFAVPMLLGPLEDQDLPSASLDLIVMMDVLEHLVDPLRTLGRCLDLLKPDGVLIIQTPCYQSHKSYADLVKNSDSFLEQLKQDEHLYLFSEAAIRSFLLRLGVEHIQFEPAVFAHYDMFLAASKLPLQPSTPEAITATLGRTTGGHMSQALLDMYQQSEDLNRRLQAAGTHRSALQDKLTTLAQRTYNLEADRATHMKSIDRLATQLQTSQLDRAARLEGLKHLGQLLAAAQADRAARSIQIHQLTQRAKDLETERAARIKTLNHLTAELTRAQSRPAVQNGSDSGARRLANEPDAAEAAQYSQIQVLADRVEALDAELVRRRAQLKVSQEDRATSMETINRLNAQLEYLPENIALRGEIQEAATRPVMPSATLSSAIPELLDDNAALKNMDKA